MSLTESIHTDEEINFKELFGMLWASKFFILICCILGIISGGYLLLNADKKYTSSAFFEMGNDESSLSSGANFEALANIAGLNGNIGASANNSLKEKIKGRVFIEKVNMRLDFINDVYFNRYKTSSVADPFWKTFIKFLISYKSVEQDIKEVVWQGIVKQYLKNVIVDISDENIITLRATHSEAERASEIVNTIMEVILNEDEEIKSKKANDQIVYLSDSLASALNDLELVQSQLKDFAVKNSALPLESFASGSLQLDSLRDQYVRTEELYDGVVALNFILQKNEYTNKDYLLLKNKFPIVDQVEFRRVLGQSEIISSWSWPEKKSVKPILDTLIERKKRLQSEIYISEKVANKSGKSLEIYSKLIREEKIAEATYTVLIEQLKAQSLFAGYNPNSSVVYEYASPSIVPSAPNMIIYIVLGAVFGIFIGCLTGLLIAHTKAVYYTSNLLINSVNADLVSNIKPLMFLRKKNIKQIFKEITKKPRLILRDLILEIHKFSTNTVVISSLDSKIKSFEFARIIAGHMYKSRHNIAIIDLSDSYKKKSLNVQKDVMGTFETCEIEENIRIFQLTDKIMSIEFLSQNDFIKDLQALKKSFDLVIISADNDDSLSLNRITSDEKVFHVILSRLKHTKRENLSKLMEIKPVQGLIHD
jgi:uncharacterized protein involved in exopolysaccharide biosynthesis